MSHNNNSGSDNQVVLSIIERAKAEIVSDICSKNVPDTITSFAELHEFCDANAYGGLIDGQFDDIINIGNIVQEELDKWISTGEYRKHPVMKMWFFMKDAIKYWRNMEAADNLPIGEQGMLQIAMDMVGHEFH